MVYESVEDYEPYEPCPGCGTTDYLGESLVMSAPIQDVQTTESGATYPIYTDEHYGETLVLACTECELTLVDNTDEVDVQ